MQKHHHFNHNKSGTRTGMPLCKKVC